MFWKSWSMWPARWFVCLATWATSSDGFTRSLGGMYFLVLVSLHCFETIITFSNIIITFSDTFLQHMNKLGKTWPCSSLQLVFAITLVLPSAKGRTWRVPGHLQGLQLWQYQYPKVVPFEIPKASQAGWHCHAAMTESTQVHTEYII